MERIDKEHRMQRVLLDVTARTSYPSVDLQDVIVREGVEVRKAVKFLFENCVFFTFARFD